jgi:hypothetical protein
MRILYYEVNLKVDCERERERERAREIQTKLDELAHVLLLESIPKITISYRPLSAL